MIVLACTPLQYELTYFKQLLKHLIHLPYRRPLLEHYCKSSVFLLLQTEAWVKMSFWDSIDRAYLALSAKHCFKKHKILDP